jgi:hypothetical protein
MGIKAGGSFMRQFAPAFVTACVLLAGPTTMTGQEGSPAHAPDGRAPQLISPLFISPKPNAPFTATAHTTSIRTLPDGSIVTAENSRMVTRDGEGRIFEQRVTFVPVPNDEKHAMRVHATDYYDPVEHTHYHCDANPKTCDLMDYYAPANEAAMLTPAGLQPDKTTLVTRENLGVDTFAGIEVQRSRETTTLYKQTVGNTNTILRTVDYWYSPALGVNVQVKRHDPRDGDQTLWLTDISLTASEPETYKAPTDYRVFDRRMSAAVQSAAEEAR